MNTSEFLDTHPRIINLLHKRFGRLVVQEFSGLRRSPTGGPKAIWKCLCDCGQWIIVLASSLRSGNTCSCGCFHDEASTIRSQGLTKYPEYRIWSHMIARCENPSTESYKYYGGRGIIVDPQWRTSFLNFIHDVGRRPSPQHQIERLDNHGPYAPGNCVWALRAEQARNTRQTQLITFQGTTLCLKDWAMKLGMSYGALRQRRLKLRWSINRTLTEPVRKRRSPH